MYVKCCWLAFVKIYLVDVTNLHSMFWLGLKQLFEYILDWYSFGQCLNINSLSFATILCIFSEYKSHRFHCNIHFVMYFSVLIPYSEVAEYRFKLTRWCTFICYFKAVGSWRLFGYLFRNLLNVWLSKITVI